MKPVFILLLSITSFTSFGQLIDGLPADENGKLNFNEVIQVDNTSQDELYLRAKQFYLDAFKLSNDLIKVDDKGLGVVIATKFTDVPIKFLGSTRPEQMWYTIKIQSKENRYKYEIYDIYFKDYPTKGTASRSQQSSSVFDKVNYFKKNGEARDLNQQYKVEMMKVIDELIKSIKTSMDNKESSDTKSDW